RELEAALVLELHDRPHQAKIAFLDKVEEPQPAVPVALGKAHHQPQVGFGQLLLGAPALGLARRDRFQRAHKFVSPNLDPALDLLDRLLLRPLRAEAATYCGRSPPRNAGSASANRTLPGAGGAARR